MFNEWEPVIAAILTTTAPPAKSGQLTVAVPQNAKVLVATVANEITVGTAANEALISPTPAIAGNALER